jgi:outer membrane protein OmpA-like peptidoglycan-associated protein
VSAASGDVTITRASAAVPSSLPNATIVQLARLGKDNAFLALGRDFDVATGPLHVWKIKGDLTIDTSFTPVNLGTSFAPPATSDLPNNFNCGPSNCLRSTLRVNENTGSAVITATREGLISATNNSDLASATSIAVLSLSTGTILGSVNNIDSARTDISGWAAFGNVAIGRDACVTAIGNEVQGVPLTYPFLETFSVMIRPDNSIVFNVQCSYAQVDQAGAFTDYISNLSLVLKPQSGSLVVDTSWGTNGYFVVGNDHTKCVDVFPIFSYDTSVNELTSTKIHHIQFIYERPRNTTPQFWQSNFTSVNDCGNYQEAPTAAKANVMSVNGKILNTLTLPVGSTRSFIDRFVIEPSGRWSGISSSFDPANQTSTYQMLKILPSGQPDTDNGTLGFKDLIGLPSTITVDGQSVRMFYRVTGVALTANSTLFTGFSIVRDSVSCSPNIEENTGVDSASYYPYYFDDNQGLVTSYGTNGLGAAFTIKQDRAKRCTAQSSPTLTFVDSKGRPAMLAQVDSLDSQQAGLLLAVWDAATGVIGGGDGSGDLNQESSSRIDTKVYRALPATTQLNTALQTLTKKQARTQVMTSNTTRTCVVVGRFVAMLGTGQCSVSVQDRRSGTILRTLKTNVTTKVSTVGSEMTLSDPVLFRKASSRISKKSRTQVRELAADAKNAQGVIVVGHAAALSDSVFNFPISRNRATTVSSLMQRLKVTRPLVTVARGSSEPVTKKKTEKAQAQNRRVVVYLIP